MPKFCVDCKHINGMHWHDAGDHILSWCKRTVRIEWDLVSGKMYEIGKTCREMREDGGACGPEGKLFDDVRN